MAECVAEECIKQAFEGSINPDAKKAIVAAMVYVSDKLVQKNSQIRSTLRTTRRKNHTKLVEQKINKEREKSSTQEGEKKIDKKIDELTDKIKKEEDAMSTFENVNNDENMKFMVALGMTGDGKSTVLNRLFGDESKYGNEGPFEAANSDQSVTQVPKHEFISISGQEGVIVDTPGYKDSKNRDDLHFNNIKRYLYGCGGIDAFLFVRNGTKNRFDANIKEMLQYHRKYFGSNFWKHLIIILTRVEGVEKDRYNEEEGAEKLRDNIRAIIDNDEVDEKWELPVVTIGFDDHIPTFQQDVMREVIRISNKDSKVNPHHIKSPIDRLKEKKIKTEKEKEEKNFDVKIATLNQEIGDINDKMKNVEKKMDNPELCPLLLQKMGRLQI